MTFQLGKSIFYLEITFIYIDFSLLQDVWASGSDLISHNWEAAFARVTEKSFPEHRLLLSGIGERPGKATVYIGCIMQLAGY